MALLTDGDQVVRIIVLLCLFVLKDTILAGAIAVLVVHVQTALLATQLAVIPVSFEDVPVTGKSIPCALSPFALSTLVTGGAGLAIVHICLIDWLAAGGAKTVLSAVPLGLWARWLNLSNIIRTTNIVAALAILFSRTISGSPTADTETLFFKALSLLSHSASVVVSSLLFGLRHMFSPLEQGYTRMLFLSNRGFSCD